jgi:hypothetical protein
MRPRLPSALALFAVVAAAAEATATAAGPTPGFADAGIVSPNGLVRYVAVPRAGKTLVTVMRISDGKLLRSTTLRAMYGVPLVAYDGTSGGLTRDGKRLLLETDGTGKTTRFVVLSTRNLKVRQFFALPGIWAYDALSPDGKTVFLTQVLSFTDKLRYVVRAYDLGLHRLAAGAIADKSEPGAMTGYPLSRVASADGVWAYTLYQRPGAQPFIHALNSRDRVAHCIDLAWKGNPDDMGSVRLTLSSDGKLLVVRSDSDGKALLTVPVPR